MYAITLDESRLPADQRWPIAHKRWWGNRSQRPQVFGHGWGTLSRRTKYSNRRDAEKEARAHGGLVVDLSTGRVVTAPRRRNRAEGKSGHHYIITLHTRQWPGGEVVLRDGTVNGLKPDHEWDTGSPQRDVRIHIGEVPPHKAGWNGPGSKAEPRTFYAGLGEGEPTKSWKAAVLHSLYNLFQVNSRLKNGDTFEVTHPITKETARFVARGVHIVPA